MNLHTIQLAAEALIAEHLGRKWKFRWHNGLATFGSCNYDTKVIAISKPLAAESSRADVMDTIGHEIAHALTPDEEHHGPEWRELCKRMGVRTRNNGWTEKIEKLSRKIERRRKRAKTV